jgi:glycosyltransferase involved in cell wall biosynthesis
MRILLLHDIGTATGGAEHQMLALRDELRQRGHAVRLLASRVEPVPGAPNLADATCFGTATRLQVLSQTVNPSAVAALRRELRHFRPDVVHARLFLWQLSPAILPLLARVPAVYHAAMYKTICPKGTKRLPGGAACRQPAGLACLRARCLTPQSWAPLMLQRALWLRGREAFDAAIALSETMRDVLTADPAAPAGPVEVIYNGVPERPARPPLESPPLAAFAGRFVPEKGGEVLLRAFARARLAVPAARLLMAGAGPEEPRWRRLASELGIAEAVEWTGFLPRPDLERRLDAAWLQAVPSQWEEPFGNVTTEAMMRGTAVVASGAGAQPEIVGRDAGILVPPTDSDGWARALTSLLADRALAERMGASGRRRALAHFSSSRCTDQIEDLYRRVLAARATPQLVPA